jgi:hypothetical protein
MVASIILSFNLRRGPREIMIKLSGHADIAIFRWASRLLDVSLQFVDFLVLLCIFSLALLFPPVVHHVFVEILGRG